METYVTSLIVNMRFVAFASMSLALMYDVIHGDVQIFRRLLYITVLVAFMANYDTVLRTGCSLFEDLKADSRQKTEDVFNGVDAKIGEIAKKATWMETLFTIPATKTTLGIGRVFAYVSEFVQSLIKLVFRVCAPVVLGLAAWKVFTSTGIRFAVGTLWVCMWSIGTAIADIMLAELLAAALGKAVLTGGTTAAAKAAGAAVALKAGLITSVGAAVGPALLIGLLVGLVVFIIASIIFYISVPIMMYSILSGGEVANGISHAISGAVGAGAGVAATGSHAFDRAKEKQEDALSRSSGGNISTPSGDTGDLSVTGDGSDVSITTSGDGGSGGTGGGGASGSGGASSTVSVSKKLSGYADKSISV